jgi:hypothetical protein
LRCNVAEETTVPGDTVTPEVRHALLNETGNVAFNWYAQGPENKNEYAPLTFGIFEADISSTFHETT